MCRKRSPRVSEPKSKVDPDREADPLRDYRDQRDVRAEGRYDPITKKRVLPDPVLEPEHV